MARKFKIGDKVQVVRQVEEDHFDSGFRVGSKGKVVSYEVNPICPYKVENLRTKAKGYFRADELELIS